MNEEQKAAYRQWIANAALALRVAYIRNGHWGHERMSLESCVQQAIGCIAEVEKQIP